LGRALKGRGDAEEGKGGGEGASMLVTANDLARRREGMVGWAEAEEELAEREERLVHKRQARVGVGVGVGVQKRKGIVNRVGQSGRGMVDVGSVTVGIGETLKFDLPFQVECVCVCVCVCVCLSVCVCVCVCVCVFQRQRQRKRVNVWVCFDRSLAGFLALVTALSPLCLCSSSTSLVLPLTRMAHSLQTPKTETLNTDA
jgi:hypothetical protein